MAIHTKQNGKGELRGIHKREKKGMMEKKGTMEKKPSPGMAPRY